MKKMLLFSIAALVSMHSFAQTEKAVKPGKIFFTSFIGIGTARGDVGSNASSGFQAMTGIEYKFDKHQSITGELNFDGYSYKVVTSAYSLDGSINTIPLTILYKYTFGKNKLHPFIEAGAGIANISVPQVTQTQGFTTIKNKSEFASQGQVALGLIYNFTPQYLIFTEASYQQFGKIKAIDDRSFGANAFRIGISSAL